MRAKAWTAIGAFALGLAATVPASAQDYEAEQSYYYQEQHDFGRFRFGVSGLGGAQWEAGPDMGMGGLALRIGAQIGNWFAVYYQPTGLIGSVMDRDPGEDSVAGLMWNTAMAEVTLGSMVQIGGGPSMDFSWGCNEDIQEEIDCATGDVFFGLDGRLALTLGDYGPGTRTGFVIEARVHSTWYSSDEASLALLGGLGFELY